MEGYLLNQQIFHLHVARAGCDTATIGMPALDLWNALERRRLQGGERRDERLGRIFRTTHRPFLWVPYRLQYVALNKPPNKPRRRQWSVWYEEENNKATLFSVLVEFKPYKNCLFLSFFRGIWIHAHMQPLTYRFLSTQSIMEWTKRQILWDQGLPQSHTQFCFKSNL